MSVGEVSAGGFGSMLPQIFYFFFEMWKHKKAHKSGPPKNSTKLHKNKCEKYTTKYTNVVKNMLEKIFDFLKKSVRKKN